MRRPDYIKIKKTNNMQRKRDYNRNRNTFLAIVQLKLNKSTTKLRALLQTGASKDRGRK